jgi:O-methyltransferase
MIKSILRHSYSMAKKTANLLGFNVIITEKNDSGKGYESIVPSATYAPWLLDKPFEKTYKKIEKYTLVDKYRCYDLWQLVEESKKLNGALIEIGVWRGGTGVIIAKKAEMCKIKDTVYLCDTFKGIVKAGAKDSYFKGNELADTSKELVAELVQKKFNLRNVKILQGTFPEETGDLVADAKFRFCHIDVDVYQSAKDIVDWIWNKLVVGGIIVYDDYGFQNCSGITKFVNEERKRPDRLVIHNLNGHATVIKLR